MEKHTSVQLATRPLVCSAGMRGRHPVFQTLLAKLGGTAARATSCPRCDRIRLLTDSRPPCAAGRWLLLRPPASRLQRQLRGAARGGARGGGAAARAAPARRRGGRRRRRVGRRRPSGQPRGSGGGCGAGAGVRAAPRRARGAAAAVGRRSVGQRPHRRPQPGPAGAVP